MFNIKEIAIILIGSLIVAFSYFLRRNFSFLIAFIYMLIILLVYTITQKITAYYFDAQAETKIWNERGFLFLEKSRFKMSIPWGFFLAFLFPLLTSGYFKWLALTETELKVKKSRVARKHYFYSYTNLTEWNISLICGTAIIALFFLSIIGHIFSGHFPNLIIFSKLCTYFALFNLLPIGNLDGMKIMMGSFKYWIFLVILTLMGFIISITL